jgi:hypothetical protein
MPQQGRPDQRDAGLDGRIRLYTVAEVADMLGLSERWLAAECRANRVEHINVARKRRFTARQVQALVQRNTGIPAPTPAMDARAQIERNLRRARRRG